MQASSFSEKTRSSGSWAILEHLDEYLVRSHQAELAARSFLDGVKALLQVAYLGFHRRIARLEAAIRLALRLQLAVEVPHSHPATLAEPEGVLQPGDDDQKNERESAHLPKLIEGLATGVACGFAEIFLDAKQLIVLGQPVRAGDRPGLDL